MRPFLSRWGKVNEKEEHKEKERDDPYSTLKSIRRGMEKVYCPEAGTPGSQSSEGTLGSKSRGEANDKEEKDLEEMLRRRR